MIPHASIAHRASGAIAPGWFDEDGFLAESENWTPSLAEDLARQSFITCGSAFFRSVPYLSCAWYAGRPAWIRTRRTNCLAAARAFGVSPVCLTLAKKRSPT